MPLRRLTQLAAAIGACLAAQCGVAGAATASGPTVTGGDPPVIGAQLTATPAFSLDQIDWATCTAAGARVGSGYLATDTTIYTLRLSDAHSDVCAVEQSPLGNSDSAPIGPVSGLPAGSAPSLSAGPGQPVAQGQTLTVTHGAWGAGASITDVWEDCAAGGCRPVASGARGSSYTVTRADAGDTIAVVETATAASDGASASATTPATAAVTPTAPQNLRAPSVRGTAQVGHRLTASTGSWSNDPTSYSYAWQRCARGSCTAIRGAHSQTYVAARADAGRSLEVVVNASVLARQGTPYPSAPTAAVRSASGRRVSVPRGRVPRPPGRATATMQWGFRYTPRYTQVLSLAIEGPSLGSTITVRCAGGGCPYAHRSRAVGARTRCGARDRCRAPRTINLQPAFRRRRLRVGARLTVRITARLAVGKDYRFVVRAGRQPQVQIACLAPGSHRPGRDCRLT